MKTQHNPYIELDYSGLTTTTALIDADSMMWIVAYRNKESEDIEAMIKELDSYIVDTLIQTKASQYAGFLSAKHTFRHDIATIATYKGNRGPEPEWIATVKPALFSHLRERWGFKALSGWEADDAVALLQRMMMNTIICSPDKDLMQVEGRHFNYVKGTWTTVTEREAMGKLWHQVLTGDRTDNIQGIPQVGPVKADRILSSCSNRHDYMKAVLTAYVQYYGDELGRERIKETVSLVRVLNPLDITEVEMDGLFMSIHAFDLANAEPSEYLREKEDKREAPNPFEY